MANYSTLKAAVADVVKTNGTQAITGANLQTVLLSIINSVGGGGYIFKGVATPSTSAGTPDENVFYIGGAGTYANFGTSVTVPAGSICVFKYNGSWVKEHINTEVTPSFVSEDETYSWQKFDMVNKMYDISIVPIDTTIRLSIPVVFGINDFYAAKVISQSHDLSIKVFDANKRLMPAYNTAWVKEYTLSPAAVTAGAKYIAVNMRKTNDMEVTPADGDVLVQIRNGYSTNGYLELQKRAGQNYYLAYTLGLLAFTSDKTVKVTRNLIVYFGTKGYTILAGTSFSLSNIESSNFSLWAIIFDIDNLQLIAKPHADTTNEDIIIAVIGAIDNKISLVVNCSVPYTLDGKYFTNAQRGELSTGSVLFKNAPLMVDSVARTISTGDSSNLVCKTASGSVILENYTKDFSNITPDSSLYCALFDYDNSQILVVPYNSLDENNLKYPVIFKIVFDLMDTNRKPVFVYDCAVPVTFDGKYFSQSQQDEIVNFTSVLTPYIWQHFKLHYTHVGNGTYGPLDTRNAITTPLHYDEDISVSVQTGYRYAIQYFDGYETGSAHLIEATGWITETTTIAANSYWCIIVANISNTTTTDRETQSLTFANARLGYIGMQESLQDIDELKGYIGIAERPYSYYGQKIQMCSFDVKSFKTLSGMSWAQSMAIYGDYAIAYSNSTNKAQLFSISSGTLLGTFDITNGGYAQPHCNTACIGTEFASSDSIMPLIYLSQWDAGVQRACFVYDVKLVGSTYSMTLVQRINLSAVSSSIIGAGECDFAVDTISSKMYAIAYKTSATDANKGTSTMVCSFALPLLSAGSEVLITDSDIISHFEMALIEYRQDAFMRNGKIYFAHGGLTTIKGEIVVIDVYAERIVTRVPIYQYYDSEPECLDVYENNKILFNYGTNLFRLYY